jgi:hypothetical protein
LLSLTGHMDEVLYFAQVLFKFNIRARTDLCVRSSLSVAHEPCLIIFRVLMLVVTLDPIVHELAVTQALIVYSLCEELVKVEVVLDQEADVAGFELQGFISKDFRLREHIKVEGTRYVAGLLLVPLEGANSNLKRVHSRAVVL